MPIAKSIRRSDYLKIRDDLLALLGVTPGEVYSASLSLGFSAVDTVIELAVHPDAGKVGGDVRPTGVNANRGDHPFAEVAHLVSVRIVSDEEFAKQDQVAPAATPSNLEAVLGQINQHLWSIAKALEWSNRGVSESVRYGASRGKTGRR